MESWFLQDYAGTYELLFAVASANDPVCEVVQALMRKYPDRPAELVISDPILGPNAKVSSLCYLQRKARYEHLVISDQDVLVPRDFLSQLIPPLADPTVGLVNCFYILADPTTPAMWMEALAVNSDFWTQVLQGNMLKPMDFALGAVMGTTRTRLERIGGFESLLDYLADDYQLGHQIARTGGRLEICRVPVECRSDPQSAAAVWKHQLRWGRTIRVCQPAPYFFSILSNATLWPLIAAVANAPGRFWLFLIAAILRIVTAQSNFYRITARKEWKVGLLAPLKDLLQVAIWASTFLGNEITWRDQRFRVNKGGKLTRLA